MLDPRDVLVFLAAGIALNVTPGPDMLYVATRAAAEGRRAGWASALGIASGGMIHASAVAFGLAAALAAAPAAYDALRYAGAAYLAYLGVRAFVEAAPSTARGELLVPASIAAVYRQGVATNVLNPKVAIFFLAFLPGFADPSRGSPAAQILALGALFCTTGTIVNLVVVELAGRTLGRWQAGPAAARVTGIVFVALAARLALSSPPGIWPF